jgi:predicted RNase H-like HicB family nuclease
MGTLMKHYIAILMPIGPGKWHALVPDVPGCEAHGASLEKAKSAATNELTLRIQANDAKAPCPRDLSAIECDHDWLARHGVDLATAVVTMIPLGG